MNYFIRVDQLILKTTRVHLAKRALYTARFRMFSAFSPGKPERRRPRAESTVPNFRLAANKTSRAVVGMSIPSRHIRRIRSITHAARLSPFILFLSRLLFHRRALLYSGPPDKKFRGRLTRIRVYIYTHISDGEYSKVYRKTCADVKKDKSRPNKWSKKFNFD